MNLKNYPEILAPKHLVKIFGKDRHTIKRWIAAGKLRGIKWLSLGGWGSLHATKESVEEFFEKQIADTKKDLIV